MSRNPDVPVIANHYSSEAISGVSRKGSKGCLTAENAEDAEKTGVGGKVDRHSGHHVLSMMSRNPRLSVDLSAEALDLRSFSVGGLRED